MEERCPAPSHSGIEEGLSLQIKNLTYRGEVPCPVPQWDKLPSYLFIDLSSTFLMYVTCFIHRSILIPKHVNK